VATACGAMEVASACARDRGGGGIREREREVGDGGIGSLRLCGMLQARRWAGDYAVTPLRPARKKAGSPAANCGPILRGGRAA
jgi:hypothetical protein